MRECLRNLIDAAILDHTVSGRHPDLSSVRSCHTRPYVTKPVDADPVGCVTRNISKQFSIGRGVGEMARSIPEDVAKLTGIGR